MKPMSNYPPDRPPDEIVADLQTALEELRTAEEELRAQNDELLTAQELLSDERLRYQQLFDLAPDGYLVTDAAGVIRETNQAAAGLLGRPARYLLDKPVRVFVVPDDRFRLDALLAAVRDGSVTRGEFGLLARGGPPVLAGLHVNAAGDDLRWLVRDLTWAKEAEARVLRAERLAAIGQTVAALAHESRNALQRALACVQMLRLEVEDRPPALDLADRAGAALKGLSRLFDDVRAATGPPTLRREPCDLRAVWAEAWELAAAGRPGATLEARGGADADCLADPFRLGQVFRNLFDNALASGAARVTVCVTDARVGGRPGVRVAVGNDGATLTPEQRRRLFEPFYTTKADGMGLGMVVVQGIIEAHGGSVGAVDTDAGTEIAFTLPRGQ